MGVFETFYKSALLIMNVIIMKKNLIYPDVYEK